MSPLADSLIATTMQTSNTCDTCFSSLSDEICSDCYELCETLENVRELAKSNFAHADTFYDIDIAIRDIYEYIKHLMRDAQQKKTKIDAWTMKLDFG